MSSPRQAGDLTTADIGCVVRGLPGIVGWEENLLLSSVEHDRDEGKTYLGFRWNDDPSPANTRRGQYAIGQYVDPEVPVRVTHPAPVQEQR